MVGKLNKILAGAIAICVLCTSAVFAKDPISVSKEGDVVTVNVNTPVSGEETTLLVVPQGVTVSDAFKDTSNICHMDQTAATAAGVATFKFKYTGTDSLDIYSGYATMSADDEPYEGVLDLSGGTGTEPGGKFTYGDVNNDGLIDAMDALDIIDNFLHGKELAVSAAADVNADGLIDAMDALDIIDNFLHGKEFKANQQ